MVPTRYGTRGLCSTTSMAACSPRGQALSGTQSTALEPAGPGIAQRAPVPAAVLRLGDHTGGAEQSSNLAQCMPSAQAAAPLTALAPQLLGVGHLSQA